MYRERVIFPFKVSSFEPGAVQNMDLSALAGFLL